MALVHKPLGFVPTVLVVSAFYRTHAGQLEAEMGPLLLPVLHCCQYMQF
jgi:hypothetical protein